MIITLITLSLLLGGYSLYLIKKHKEDTHTHFILFNHRIDELKKKTLYLLDELDNKIKTSEESLLSKLKEINTQNQENNNKMHQQLVSGEFKKFKSDMDKTLNGMIKNVENIKFE